MQSLYSFQQQSNELEHFWKCFDEWTSFVWQEWWESLNEFRKSWTPQEYKQACPLVSGDNHHWEQYEKSKLNNQQFQD